MIPSVNERIEGWKVSFTLGKQVSMGQFCNLYQNLKYGYFLTQYHV